MKFRKENAYTYMELFVPCYLILSCYTILGHASLSLLGVVLAIISLLKRNKMTVDIKSNYPIFILLIYIISHDLIKMIVIESADRSYLNSFIETLIFLVAFLLISPELDEERIYKVWKIIGAIVFVIILYQAVQVYILGNEVATVYFLPQAFRTYRSGEYRLRPQGVFIEPGQVVDFYIPLFFMNMKRRRIKDLILISLAILLTGSTFGIAFLIYGWITYIVFILKIGSVKAFGTISITIGLVLLFVESTIFKASRGKLLSVILGKTSQVRFGYGFRIIADTEWLYLLFGVPYANMVDYLSHASFSEYVSTIYYAYSSSSASGGYEFTNALTYWIVIYGIAGLGIVLYVFLHRFTKVQIEWKLFIIWTFITYLGQGGGITHLFIPIALIYGLKEYGYKKSNVLLSDCQA